MSRKLCIVIPIYRELTVSEEAALKQMHNVFKDKSNVHALCPVGLDISKHKQLFPELKETRLDKRWFESTDTYSQMLVSKWFYSMFSRYEYLLICQLDVWLVKDELLEWCEKGYDYVGAPIVVPTARWHNYRIDYNGNTIVTPKVGNGGFSLRKVSTFIELTDPSGYVLKHYRITQEQVSKVIYEDLWFCDELDKLYDLRRPYFDKAFKFAIDMNPDLIESQWGVVELPMAIHAFDKNIPYWRKRIPELSSDDIYEECYAAHKEFIDLYYYKKAPERNERDYLRDYEAREQLH